MLVEKMHPDAKPEDPIWTTNIMLYELGLMTKNLIYGWGRRKRARDHDDVLKANAYLADAKMELADLVTQCRVMAEQLDCDWSTLVSDGEERFAERMDELRRRII